MGSNSESVSTVMGSTNFAGLFGHVLICVSRFGCLRSSHFCSKHKTKNFYHLSFPFLCNCPSRYMPIH
ncbi:unnamed protein product [Brassica rapa]|uniref:Uncharacterized protein n=1 Tax=Brassica campestris TaxID=3711 RepID=A0A8D9DJH5_BRACM|nr:unnamed protein product [Brassica rapa]